MSPSHGHMTSRPAFSQPQSRGDTESMPEPTKRKSTADSDTAPEPSKRPRGHSAARSSNASSLTSVPETVLESELARTPQNQSFVEEPTTPTATAPSGAMKTPRADKKQSTNLPLPPTAPTKFNSETPATPPKPTSQTADSTSRGTLTTPLRLSSSNTDPACVDPPQSSSHRCRHPDAPKKPNPNQRTSQARESNNTTQIGKDEMEQLMKYELSGQVFVHKQFYKEFLPIDPGVQEEVRSKIMPSGSMPLGSLLGYSNERWTIHESIALQSSETQVYNPLASLLNVIGRGAYEVYRERHPEEQFRQHYRPFHNHSNSVAFCDSPSDAATSPDLVMGHDAARTHWGDMDLLIECKSHGDENSQNKAYLQLGRYARATFAHQIYRLHVLGFSLCGSIVNFVRFDRSGLIHSYNLDLSESDEAHEFVQHLITLLTISPDEFGYDTRYSFRPNNELNIVETLFKFNGRDAEVVSELICHRKGACGRATCVCALGEDVHKSIWRPDDRPDEGDTLTIFDGVFAVCQLKARHSGQYSTKLKYPEELKVSPAASFFLPGKRVSKTVAGPSTSSIRKNSAGAQPAPDVPEALGPTPPCSGVRGVRVKSDILMPRGTSLFDAQSSYHLLLAIHDALMGIMAFTEAGKIHCDISAYNLLLINATKHYVGSWLKEPKVQASAEVWNRTAKGTNVREETDEHTSPRMARVKGLKRGPVCVVHDTEFTVDEDRPEGETHTDRTGTPAFISSRLLKAHMSGESVTRTFIHDVESLLWVLVWVVAHHSQKEDRWQISKAAREVIQGMSQNNWDKLAAYKQNLLGNTHAIQETVRAFDNKWSAHLAPVIGRLASFLYPYIYIRPELHDPDEDDSLEGLVDLHEKLATSSRGSIFAQLFGIFDKALAKLETRCPPIDNSKL